MAPFRPGSDRTSAGLRRAIESSAKGKAERHRQSLGSLMPSGSHRRHGREGRKGAVQAGVTPGPIRGAVGCRGPLCSQVRGSEGRVLYVSVPLEGADTHPSPTCHHSGFPSPGSSGGYAFSFRFNFATFFTVPFLFKSFRTRSLWSRTFSMESLASLI